jgi:hypothetical protein
MLIDEERAILFRPRPRLRRLGEIESPAPEEIRRGSHKGFWSRVKEAFTGG